jgi:hypothetical protein
MTKFVTRMGVIGHVYHDGTQMIVINKDKPAKVPEDDVDRLEREGIIGAEGDDVPAGADKVDDLTGQFTAGAFRVAKAPGVGSYAISGPGLDEPETVRGKDKTQARLDDLNKAAAGSDAPVD